MKPKVYLETTIPSFLTALPSRDIIAAGQQQATRECWYHRRHRYGLFVSGLVLLECRRGDRAAAKAREDALDQIPVLGMSGVVQDLAQILITSGLIPPKAAPDAVHIAIAAVHGMEFLLTWNCRHIANAAIVDRVRRMCGVSDSRHQ
ncbi:MAG: type II toxin-antitoxin system VapC family toxin [Bacteriovoracia bacterium]